MGSNNYLKKVNKKLRMHQHVVNKETGVICCNDPTKNLAICNAGQINGLTEEIVVASFQKYGLIERVLLIPGKSCCFISYQNTISSEEAFRNVNGTLPIAQDGKPIFVSYVEELPAIKDSKIWNKLPPGLIIIPNYINESEETRLLSLHRFDDNSGNMKHRRVKHYGYEFRYDINNVDKDKPLPENIPKECDFLWAKLPPEMANFHPDQLTINHYAPGQGIPSHIDTHSAFESPILSLSLGSAVIMEFKNKTETHCVLLPQRSLLIMSGESRYDWSHGITPKKFDFYYTNNDGCVSFERGVRVSFTFRKVLKGECNCSYNLNCDSQNNTQIAEDLAEKLEKEHVHEVYEDIAEHFSETRHKPWPNVLNYVREFSPGSVVVDVGCGNGKYFGHNNNIVQIGTDRSFKLNELCKERGFETFSGNCLHLPLKDSSADGALSIAVIHHLSTEERRLEAISEMVRILRPGGTALIYVWAKAQVKDEEKSTYLKQDRKHRKTKNDATSITHEEVSINGINLPVHTNRTGFNHSDVLVPWKLKGEEPKTFLRFYHVFEDGELEELCLKLTGVSVVSSYYDQGNCCVIIRKNI